MGYGRLRAACCTHTRAGLSAALHALKDARLDILPDAQPKALPLARALIFCLNFVWVGKRGWQLVWLQVEWRLLVTRA